MSIKHTSHHSRGDKETPSTDLNIDNFDLSLNFDNLDLAFDNQEEEKEEDIVTNEPTVLNEPTEHSVIEHNDGTGGFTAKKAQPKKVSLFDRSRIAKKEEHANYKKEYDFKSFIEGEDGLTKEILRRQRKLRQDNPDNQLHAIRVLDLDLLMGAPDNYFDKYSKDVKNGVLYCRGQIADNDLAQVISIANDNPTNEEYQNDAYLSISRYIVEFIKTTEHRDANQAIVANLIVNELLGFDMLDPLWHSPKVTEIVCNGPFDVQVEIGGEMQRVKSVSFRDRDHLSTLLERLFRSVGKTLAQSTPQVKGRLHDKSRIFATHHSISPDGPNFNIRRHPHGFWTPEALIERGAADDAVMEYLGNLIHKGASFIIAGGTSTGKMLTLDTKIRTSQGFTPMGNIQIDDEIIDHHGEYGKVTDIFKHKPQQVYAMKFSNNETVYNGLEHNWFARDNRKEFKNNENPYEVITTQELIERGAQNFSTPFLSQPITYKNGNNVNDFDINPYEFGLKLSASPTLNNQNILCETIPDNYKYSSIKSRTLFALGMIHGSKARYNAQCTKGNVFYTSNEDLANDFIEVTSSLGFISTKELITGKEYFEIRVDEDFPLTVDNVYSEREHNDDNVGIAHKELNILSVEPVDGRVEEMWCITVDTPDSTYLVGNSFITTHNTSMLNALTGFYPSNARILTLEDNLEMKPNPKKYLAAALETRPPAPDKLNDTGITMRDLVWGAMQMRPEVLIIGEVTDAAAYDLCQALNTGHAGASTFHANSSQLAITRVASLVAQSGLTTIDGAFDLISAAFDFVINLRHFPQDGSRKIFSIDEVGTEIESNDGKPFLRTKQLWKFDNHGVRDNKVQGAWKQVGDISPERAERRMFDSQVTLSWEQLKVLSAVPEGTRTA